MIYDQQADHSGDTWGKEKKQVGIITDRDANMFGLGFLLGIIITFFAFIVN